MSDEDDQEQIDQRVEELTDTLISYARLNFGKRPAVRGDGPFDAIATGLQMLAEELESAQHAGKFGAPPVEPGSSSNEPQSPIASLLAASKEAQRHHKGREYLDYLRREGDSLQALTESLLLLAELSSAPVEPVHGPVNLADLLNKLREALVPTANAKRVQLLMRGLSETPPITLNGNESLITIITKALLSHAIANSAHRTDVSLTANLHEAQGDVQVTIDICDVGPPLDPKSTASLNDPFDRDTPLLQSGDIATRFGIGLAIAHAGAQQMGGNVVATRLNDGTNRLRLTWSATVWNASPTTSEDSAPTPCRVLLAEDNDALRSLTRHLLEDLGLRVTSVSNGAEAVEAFQRDTFDLVFMDCNMPSVDGFEAARRIRSNHPGHNTPIVALTAYSLIGEQRKFTDAGMADVLSKPFDRAQLIACVERNTKRRG